MFLFRRARNRKVDGALMTTRSLAAVTIQHAWLSSRRYRFLKGTECDSTMRGLKLSIYKLLECEPSPLNIDKLTQKYTELHLLRTYKDYYSKSI